MSDERIAIKVERADASHDRTIFVSEAEEALLMKHWNKKDRRYSVRHYLSQEDRDERTWHLDLDAVTSIYRVKPKAKTKTKLSDRKRNPPIELR